MGISSWLARTFLIERLTGVLVYALVIGCTYLYLRQSETYGKFKRTLNICLFILCVMAFIYIPAESADLFRIRNRIEVIRFWSWDYLKNFISNNSSPGAYLLYFLMSRINIKGILPTIACFVFFSNIFHILKEEKKIDRSDSRSLALTYFYFMAQGLFLGAISGIRNAIAFSIIARVIYDDYALQKKGIINYILCLIALSFHISAAPIVAIYMLFSIYDNWKNRRVLLTLVTLIGGIGAIYWVFRSRSDFIDTVLNKAEIYTSGTTYSNRWEYLIVGLSIILLLYTLVRYRKASREDGLHTIFVLAIFLMIGVLMMFRNYTIFHRYGNFMMYISLPLIAKSIENDFNKNTGRVYKVVKYGSWLILLLTCTRGDLSGYKFFLLS